MLALRFELVFQAYADASYLKLFLRRVFRVVNNLVRHLIDFLACSSSFVGKHDLEELHGGAQRVKTVVARLGFGISLVITLDFALAEVSLSFEVEMECVSHTSNPLSERQLQIVLKIFLRHEPLVVVVLRISGDHVTLFW